MRVAMISPLPDHPNRQFGIVGMFVRDLVQALRSSDIEVVSFGGDGSGPNGRLREVDARSIEVGSYLELAHATQACRAIRHASPPFDVVHAHVPSALPFARYIDAPTVHTVHHPFVAGFESFYAEFEGITHVLSLSSQRRAIANGEAPLFVPYGLNASRYAPTDGSAGFVAFLGGLTAREEPQLAIDAARAAGVPLLITGPHGSDDEGQPCGASDLRRSSPNVGGFQSHEGDTAFFCAARALVVPESQPGLLDVVIIEALLCGTPLVASVHSDAAELVAAGRNGFVYDSGGSLARGLSSALALDRGRIRADALERFSIQRCARAYAAAYMDAIERRRANGARASNVIAAVVEPSSVAG